MKNPGTPGVSVIIPVYNTEDYLRQCLDSAVNQTLRDLEIICVNDGSTDDSAAVLEEYQAKDPRIIVVSQKNLGLSAARNRGMKMARGTYIYFLDSDDEVDLQTLERCTELAEEHGLDAVVFGSGSLPIPKNFCRFIPAAWNCSAVLHMSVPAQNT